MVPINNISRDIVFGYFGMYMCVFLPLGDVKMKTKAEYSRERRRGSLHDPEHRILEGKNEYNT